MNTRILIAAAALGFASPWALASEASQFDFRTASSTVSTTRAEVQAEITQARRAGALQSRNEGYGTRDRSVLQQSSRDRADVRAEARDSRAVRSGTAYGSFRFSGQRG